MKIKDTTIVINSSHRADKVITPTLFPEDVIEWVIAVPEDQIEEYAKYWPNKLVPIPSTVAPYLSSQRQWVMENYWDAYKYVWFMDDDLKFFHRAVEGKTNLTRSTSIDHICSMFLDVREQLSTTAIVSISERFGNNFVTTPHKDIGKIRACYAVDTHVFKEVGAVFNPIEPFQAQDYHIVLCFLNAGYINRALFTYAFDEKSSAPGGCSVYRTAKTVEDTSKWMAANHPEVTVKIKYSKTKWGMTEVGDGTRARVDIMVQWKKAYRPKPIKPDINKLFGKKK